MQAEISNYPNLATKQKWDAIYQYKEMLLNTGQLPTECPLLREEVAASWLRSYASNVNAGGHLTYAQISQKQWQSLLATHERMLDIAKSLLHTAEELAAVSQYIVCLTDARGVVLHLAGNDVKDNHQEHFNFSVGDIIDERSMGCSAHALALRYSRPVQLIGPENYAHIYANNISSSAPIFNDDKTLLGSLTFILERSRHPYTEESHALQANALGWVTFMAQVITDRIALEKMAGDLFQTNEALETTLTYIDEGIISINRKGEILSVNAKCEEILTGGDHRRLEGAPISSFFKGDSDLPEHILAGEKLDYVEDILVTGHGERSYLLSSRPIFSKAKQGLAGAIIRISNRNTLQKYVQRQEKNAPHFTFDDILGESVAIRATKKVARVFADNQENILLMGESGTGKEMFAQSIHNIDRPKGAFVALNCAALPLNLVESELFGYEGGSFTGAEHKGKPGKIELADQGTLFLDEIGDMALDMQAVLLRVLEDRHVMRIGGNSYREVDFRLIAATNQNLPEMIENKQFREDLYYRLSALVVEIPPLRNREEDILLLAEHFIDDYCKKLGRQYLILNDAAKDYLLNYDWPGNVRQLQKTMVYTVSMSHGHEITPASLPKSITSPRKANDPARDSLIEPAAIDRDSPFFTMQEMEKQQIRRALALTNNNVTKAARLLAIGRSTLYAKIKEYQITIA